MTTCPPHNYDEDGICYNCENDFTSEIANLLTQLNDIEANLYTAWYQIARALAQLEGPLTVEGDMNYKQVRLAAESIVFQLGAYLETTDYEPTTIN